MADQRPITRINELPPGASLDDNAYFVAYDPVNEEEKYTALTIFQRIREWLGTAASADLTESATDTTAGRVLKVGDFGIGSTIESPQFSGTDANDIDFSSELNANGITTNLPAGTNDAGIIKTNVRNTGSSTLQISQWYFWRTEVHYRHKEGATWQPWQEIFHTGNIATYNGVQQGATDNGSIIESGSNANGEYVKYADGTLICTFLSAASSTTTTAAGALYQSAGTAFTFPAVFVSVPKVAPAAEALAGPAWANFFSTSISGVTMSAVGTSATRSAKLGYIAIGRWK